MQATLADPNNDINKKRIHDAFGPNPNIDEIKKNVGVLQNAHLKVLTADPAVIDRIRDDRSTTGLNQPGQVLKDMERGLSRSLRYSAQIGPEFHNPAVGSDKQRAAELIHNAANQHLMAEAVVEKASKKLEGPPLGFQRACMCSSRFLA